MSLVSRCIRFVTMVSGLILQESVRPSVRQAEAARQEALRVEQERQAEAARQEELRVEQERRAEAARQEALRVEQERQAEAARQEALRVEQERQAEAARQDPLSLDPSSNLDEVAQAIRFIAGRTTRDPEILAKIVFALGAWNDNSAAELIRRHNPNPELVKKAVKEIVSERNNLLLSRQVAFLAARYRLQEAQIKQGILRYGYSHVATSMASGRWSQSFASARFKDPTNDSDKSANKPSHNRSITGSQSVLRDNRNDTVLQPRLDQGESAYKRTSSDQSNASCPAAHGTPSRHRLNNDAGEDTAKAGFGSVSTGIRLCIFDLDQTLASTADLEKFRGKENVGRSVEDISDGIVQHLQRTARRQLISEAFLNRLVTGPRPKKIAVFTRSPRSYAVTLLKELYPSISWATLIGYEDVGKTKPSGEGIRKIMADCNILDPRHVAMIGDDKNDILAAYNIGCYAFLFEGGWNRPWCSSNYWALERIPDARVTNEVELEKVILDPDSALPELEYQLAPKVAVPNERTSRFDCVNFWHPGASKRFVRVNIAGRMFSHYGFLKASHQAHALTKQILAHKNSKEFPDEWINVILQWIGNGIYSGQGRVIVTVIPFKPGREPRLESLLRQTEASHIQRAAAAFKARIQFIADLFYFLPGVMGNHSNHLGAVERFKNIQDHLRLVSNVSVQGCRVIVVDDVVTSGSTLFAAHELLSLAGAAKIECLSLAKAIGDK